MLATVSVNVWHDLLLAGLILAAGFGVPVPIAPLLLATGAMASTGKPNVALILLVPPLCLALGDSVWFFLGRRYGKGLLQTVCRISFERDTCVRKTQEAFQKHGLRSLLFSRFIPGLSALASPMAGATQKPFFRFFLFDLAGVVIYSMFYLSLGYAFASQLNELMELLGGASTKLAEAAVIIIGAYAGFKYFRRYQLIQKSMTLAIDANEVNLRRIADPTLQIIDLRGPHDLEVNPHTIPGSRQLRESEFMKVIAAMPKSTPIVLFCACPNQASSTRLAVDLRDRGYTNIWPMRDGIDGWISAGLAVQSAAVVGATTNAA